MVMLIGIISDSHDNVKNLEKALSILKDRKVEAIIHCGDLCAPFMVPELDKAGVPVHLVFGNIEDRYKTPRKCEESEDVIHHGDVAEIELGRKRIAVTHFDIFAEGLADTFKYDAVFHGHTHAMRKEQRGKTLLVNPGDIYGRHGKASLALYNTDKNEIEFVEF